MPIKADPITLSTVWSGLFAIADETGIALRRSAYTNIVREADDFSAAVFDGAGRMLAEIGTPGQLGPMPFLIKSLLQDFPAETWLPGDAVILNDPAIGAGHLPDIYAVVPVIWHDELVGFTACICHHLDVGGPRPGSMTIEGVVDLVSEGLHLMPLKLWQHGELREDIFSLICNNVRATIETGGDLKAQRNCQEYHAVPRVLAFFDRYGKEMMNACFDEIIARTETALREEIRKLSDGEYSAEQHYDGYGPGTPPIKCKVTVTIKDDDITADFTGSSDQVPAGINSYLCYTRSYVYASIKSLLIPSLPQNEGGTRPIKVTAPEGSFFNPRYGAPCGGRAILSSLIYGTVVQALAPALPDTAMGVHSGLIITNIGGINPRTGMSFTDVNIMTGGSGAFCDQDGLDFLSGPMNIKNTPIEVREAAVPIREERMTIATDSGGPGKFRGGVGLRKDFRYLAETTHFSNNAEKIKFAAEGIFGGKPGAKAKSILYNADGKEEFLEGMGNYEFKCGDLVSVTIAGAGGFGNPFERDPERVLNDVIEGYVSLEGARRDYGVVIDPQTLVVDHEATVKLRVV